jgi:hypothetical protein
MCRGRSEENTPTHKAENEITIEMVAERLNFIIKKKANSITETERRLICAKAQTQNWKIMRRLCFVTYQAFLIFTPNWK